MAELQLLSDYDRITWMREQVRLLAQKTRAHGDIKMALTMVDLAAMLTKAARVVRQQ